MTETDAAPDRASLVPGAHRLIRALDGKEGPFAGTLVVFDDAVAVCIDAERLKDWAGWAFSGAEHVCGVLDVRRRADGHDALLPWCTQRVEAFLGRRDSADSSLTPGEQGTLVVSLLRGVRELGTSTDALGEWWLTGDGRPLFVHGDGGSARAGTAALIDRMARQETDRATVRVLEEAASALRQPRHPADDDRRWEEQLFARAAPRALRLDVFAPQRVGEVAPRLVAADVASRERDDRANSRRIRADRRKRERGVVSAAGVLRAVSTGTRMRLDRLRERPIARGPIGRETADIPKKHSSRRRSVLVAGALGAAVLIVGLLWPSEGGDSPAEASSSQLPASADSVGDPGGGDDSDPTTAASDAERTPPADTDSTVQKDEDTDESADHADHDEGAPGGGTALDAVPALLDAISACSAAAADECADAVAEGARTPADGIATLGASESSATLVDDYGDVAVIRLTPLEAGTVEQMLVLERRNEIWLVRDVYDVAHQPE